MLRIISLLLVVLLTMANGKLEYTPYPSRAVAIPGSLYLLLSEPTNLIGVNPGAEVGDLTGWDQIFVTISAAEHYEGSKSFSLTGSAFLYSAAGNTFNLTKNQSYKIIFAAKSATLDNLWCIVTDENGLGVFNPGTPTTLTASWKLYSFNFTSAQNFTGCKINFTTNAATGVFLDSILIAPEYLDMGTEDFSIDILHQPLTQTGNRTLVRKVNTASPNEGYHFYYSGTDYKYYFYLGDNTANVTAFSAAVTAIQNQEWHWVRVTLDRSGNLTFYVNGVASGSTTAISTIGNCSALDELRLFGWDSVTYLYKGFVDFVRFQRGTIRSAAWMAAEWARIQAGRIRETSSATALWDFNNDLVDDCQGLILEENTGTVTYADGWPYCVSPITYNFSQNYTYDYQIIPLAADSIVRSYRTGAAFLTAGPRKYSYTLPFTCIEEAQMSAFFAAWEGKEPVKLWLDKDEEQTDEVYFTDPPEKRSKAAFRAGNYVYDTELHLEGT